MDRQEARAIAERMLDEAFRPGNDDVVIVDRSTRESADSWVFVYQSRTYLETGSFVHMLIGNAPIFVDKATGQARFGRTDISVEEQLSTKRGSSRIGTRPVVDHTDPVGLGVHPARRAIHAQFTGVPTYLRRDAHDAVAAAAARPGLVLIAGPALAGKTRLAFEVLHQALSDRQLVVPADPAALRELRAEASHLADTVIWLDDATQVMWSGALTDAVEAFRRTEAVFLATLTVPRDAPDDSPWPEGTLPDATVIQLAPELTPAERSRLEGTGADPRVRIAAWASTSKIGFGEYLAAGPDIAQRWERALAGDQPTAAAVITAAVAAREHGFRAPIPRALLAGLYPHFLADDRPGDLAEALDWAVQPAVPGARGCLVPVPGDRYQPFPYLEHVPTVVEGGEMPLPAWRALLDHADDEQAHLIGLSAEPRYRQAAEAGDAQAMYRLGCLYEKLGNRTQAVHWHREATKAGEQQSLARLGHLMIQAGNPEQAERLFEAAVQSGHPDAETLLENLRRHRR